MTPEEAKDLLRQSNYVDYAETMKKFDQVAGCHLPPDTPVKYERGFLSGWEDMGEQCVMSVNIGDCELTCNLRSLYGLNVFKQSDCDWDYYHSRGIRVMDETTLGDRETFYKHLGK